MSTKKQMAVGTALIAAFFILMVGVMRDAQWVQVLDGASAHLLRYSGALNTAIYMAAAKLGSPLIAIGLSLGLSLGLVLLRQPGLASWLLGMQLGGAAVAEGIKFIVQRARPTGQLVADTGYSFPSGHTFCTTMLVMSVIYVTLPLIEDQENQLVLVLIGIVWVGLVAAARVYLRDHFGTDVVASVLLAGGLWNVLAPLRNPVVSRIDATVQRIWVREGKA